MHLHLQSKARLGFKKLLKMNGKLDKQPMAFFYLADSPHSNNGQYFKVMQVIKTKMKQFWSQWVKYNQNIQDLP